MTRWLLIAIFLGAAAPPEPEPAPAPRTVPARWIADWAEQRCSLVRETGGPDAAAVMLRTVPGTGHAELWVLDPKWEGPQRPSIAQLEIAMDPTGARFAQSGYVVIFRGQPGIAITNLESGFIDGFAGATRIRVGAGGKTYGEYPVPGSAKAVAALRNCEAEVMRDWGLDPAVINSLRQSAEPDKPPVEWFSDADYPSEAIKAQQSGTVLARYTVDVTGRVTECVIVDGSGHAALDRQTCAVIVKRGRYKPAIAADGRPTRSMAAIRIRWLLPVA